MAAKRSAAKTHVISDASRTKSSAAASAKKSQSEAEEVRYVLLLRGVNVGKNNSLPMADLRAMLTELGCTDIVTYLQSGNAVFATTLAPAVLTAAIERLLEDAMGRPIATTVRTQSQMRAVLENNPFEPLATKPAYLCVTFLEHVPTPAERAPLETRDWSPEQVRIVGTEIYSWHPNGQGRSALAQKLSTLTLRGAVTTRNWNTVCKLHELLLR